MEGLRVIITGASSGIGRQLALQIARQKGRLIVNARHREQLQTLAEEISILGAQVSLVVGDVTDPLVQGELLKSAEENLGGLDCLINNAGVGAMGAFSEANPQRLRQIMELNFFAACDLTRLALPLLRDSSNGLIVNVGSVLGYFGAPDKSEYCASKFALHGFSEALRAEVRKDGIDLLLVAPSTTDSQFFANAIEDTTSNDWKKRGAMSPEVVARKIVVAMQKGKSEIVLSFGGKALVRLKRWMPGVFRHLIALSR